ncbi:glycoside hydrolase [Paenibacillus sp. MWE-103]|uniref:Glycoside hydrolase n=1 Tax=Paenibacillus artemisiicola TaxID=1172618 RepID=A0ABS3W9W4_9BACL|nr:GH25 family lysozyme [Paenibacillus artemisiicola]MBO7745097.1 glycoside hydrolase [Paenibacillus artemisiicola]
MQSKSASNVKVIDVSHHQSDRGAIDWAAVKEDGVAGAFVKASEGGSGRDKGFAANASGAAAAGLKVGFYHYAHPELNAPKEEAANFASAVEGRKADFPHVLDVEGEARKIGAEKLTAWCADWLQEVERLAGHPVMVYTGASFARSNLGQALGKWPLWVAHYDAVTPMANPTWAQWAVFQYTSEGSVNGIQGNVDVNAMEQSFFDAYGGSPGARPADADADADAIKIVVNDKLAGYGRILDGHAYAPLQHLGEALGLQVAWNEKESVPYVGGRAIRAFKLIGGKAYIGVRSAAELLGGRVSYDEATKKVHYYG